MMKQADFEKLAYLLTKMQRRVNSEKKLLEGAYFLLEAQAVFLIQRTSGDHLNVLGAYPREFKEAGEEHLEKLVGWYDTSEFYPNYDGVSFGEEFYLPGHNRAPDVLVAWGQFNNEMNLPINEIIIFQSKEASEPFHSYHCWAAATLLKQFEFFSLEIQKYLLEEENSSLEEFVNDFVLWDDSWGKIVNRVERMKDPPPDWPWKQALIWTGYHSRPDRSKYQKPEKASEALEWIKEEYNKENNASYIEAMEYMVGDELLQNEFSSHLKNISIAKNGFIYYALLLEHSWYRLLKECGPRLDDPKGPSKRESLNKYYPIDHIIKSTYLTLFHTNSLVSSILSGGEAKGSGGNGGSVSGQAKGSKRRRELGRDELRLYFATILAKSRRLGEQYLNLCSEGTLRICNGSENVEPRRKVAPPEVMKEYVLSLSRFMLQIISIIEKMLNIRIDLIGVSPTETLDALLYLVDRYAHVEMAVDERLCIREHLGSSVAVEVQHHLNTPRYRDHLVHVIDVFLLGHFLLNTKLCWIEEEKDNFKNHISKLARGQGYGGDLTTFPDEWLKNWAVASLLHDIGYQIGGDGDNITRDNKVLERFFKLQGKPFIEWPIPKDRQAPEDFLREMKKAILYNANDAGSTHGFSKLWMPEGKSLDIRDHGVTSAMRIAQILINAEALDPCYNSDAHKMITYYYPALHAVSHHNLHDHRVKLSTTPIACLLRLCDELQEWGRRRVNIEKMVKRLYINIEEGKSSSAPTYEMLDRFEVNIIIKQVKSSEHFHIEIPTNGDDFWDDIEMEVENDEPILEFHLAYKNPENASFDTTTTVLSKAYNLQHLDLSVSDEGQNNLQWRLILKFPCPADYGHLKEYDIYGLFTNHARYMPLLYGIKDIKKTDAGLMLYEEGQTRDSDCFAIILSSTSASSYQHGWLTMNPRYFFEDFIKFKENLLYYRIENIL